MVFRDFSIAAMFIDLKLLAQPPMYTWNPNSLTRDEYCKSCRNLWCNQILVLSMMQLLICCQINSNCYLNWRFTLIPNFNGGIDYNCLQDWCWWIKWLPNEYWNAKIPANVVIFVSESNDFRHFVWELHTHTLMRMTDIAQFIIQF